VSEQTGNEASEQCMDRPWRRRTMRRVCTGTPVHYEQTVRGRVEMQEQDVEEKDDAATVYGYTGTL